VKTVRKEQGRVVMYTHLVVVIKPVFYYKNEALLIKKCVWALRVEAFKKHSAVVVKEFWLRKTFNFFNNTY